MQIQKINTNGYSYDKKRQANFGNSANFSVAPKVIETATNGVPEVLMALAGKMSDRASRILDLVTGLEITYQKLNGKQVISLTDEENRFGTGIGDTVQDALKQAYARYAKLKDLSAQHRVANVPITLRKGNTSPSFELSQRAVN